MHEEGNRRAAAREKSALSCTECRRKKKKCSGGEPCKRCARTYPATVCIYIVAKGTEMQPFHSAGSHYSFASTPGRPLSIRTIPSGSSTPSLTRGDSQFISGTTTPKRSHEDINFVEEGVEKVLPSYRGVEPISEPFKPFNPMAPSFNTFDLLRLQSVAPTIQNANLLHLYSNTVVPAIITIDITSKPNIFAKYWLPASAASPLLLRADLMNGVVFRVNSSPDLLGILGISNSKEEERIRLIHDRHRMLELKTELIHMVNERLRLPGGLVSEDVAITVFCFIYYDFYPGNWVEILSHTRGLAELVRLRGGLKKFGMDGLLRMMIALQHYHISIVCESEPLPILLDNAALDCIVDFSYPPISLASPLCSPPSSFSLLEGTGYLSEASASILDDMATLSTAVCAYMENYDSEISPESVIDTALEVFDRLSAYPEVTKQSKKFEYTTILPQERVYIPIYGISEPSKVHDTYFPTILAVAKVYATAIICRTPFSRIHTPDSLGALISALEGVSLEQWAHVPGVWLWALLVVNTTGRDVLQSEWWQLRGSQQSAAMEIALRNWATAVKCVHTFLTVQRWTRGHVPAESLPSNGSYHS